MFLQCQLERLQIPLNSCYTLSFMPIQSCTQDSPGVFVGHSNGPLIPCSPQRAHFPPKSNHPQMGHPVRQHAHISSPFWLHLYGHSCINNHTLLCLKAVYKGSGLLWRASFVAVMVYDDCYLRKLEFSNLHMSSCDEEAESLQLLFGVLQCFSFLGFTLWRMWPTQSTRQAT